MVVPSIQPVATQDRPTWSVMIPAWNAAEFLGATLDSVLAADLPDGSQIEVVDDRSTDGTPEIAAQYAERDVRYHRHDVQHGAAANYNACIRRARGHLVHLLHADDEVVSGFYATLGTALTSTPAVAAWSRTAYIDAADHVTTTTRSEGESGIWRDGVRILAISNRIRPPAIAVRRSAYEEVGGFREDLHHAADWDMWMRLALHGPMWFENQTLARYRVSESQDTSAQLRRAGNITERVAVLDAITDRLPPDLARWAMRRGLLDSSVFAARTALRLGRRGDWPAALAQFGASVRCAVGGVIASPTLPLRGAASEPQIDDAGFER